MYHSSTNDLVQMAQLSNSCSETKLTTLNTLYDIHTTTAIYIMLCFQSVLVL